MRRSARMRRDWEVRAAADPLFHINATQHDWSLDEFYADGTKLVGRIVDPVLARLGVQARGVVLEIGCGMGRLFPGLATRFDEVWGADISATMIARGRKHCPVPATWLRTDGGALPGVRDGSVNHVLSFEVFQHIPEPADVFAYLAETRRVLVPGGTFQHQLRRGSDTRAQAVFRTLPRGVRVAASRMLRVLGVHRVVGDPDTWLGSIIDPVEATAQAERLGFAEVAVLDDPVHAPGMGYWLVGRAPQ